MASRTALILETNPVITERYLDYTHDSDWRIMLKDTLNGFLEKLQQEKFNLIVAEESLVPQGIIAMMKSTGIPFLLSTNTKNAEIKTLPRNFNRTELLTVFDRMVPPLPEETNENDDEDEKTDTVHDILSGLEDNEEAFELTSDEVVSGHKPAENTAESDLFGNSFDEEDFFSDETGTTDKGSSEFQPVTDNKNVDFQPETVSSTRQEDKKTFQVPPSSFDDNDNEIDSIINSFSNEFRTEPSGNTVPEAAGIDLKPKAENTANQTAAVENNSDFDDFLFGDSSDNEFKTESSSEYKPEITKVTPIPKQDIEKPEEPRQTAKTVTANTETEPDNEIKAAVFEWLEKNARSIIKETVLEQLASLSGKNND